MLPVFCLNLGRKTGKIARSLGAEQESGVVYLNNFVPLPVTVQITHSIITSEQCPLICSFTRPRTYIDIQYANEQPIMRSIYVFITLLVLIVLTSCRSVPNTYQYDAHKTPLENFADDIIKYTERIGDHIQYFGNELAEDIRELAKSNEEASKIA